MLVLSGADVARLLDVDRAIESQRRAFAELGGGRALLPARLLVAGAEDSVAFCYAARLTPDSGAVCKLGSVNPANAERGLPTISALITVLDGADGRPAAVMDGTSVTTIRTSAASAVAVDLLARRDASRIAVLGSGTQAEAHVRAVARVRDLSLARLWSRNRERCESLAASLDTECPFPVAAAGTAEAAVRGADVVLTCTTSTEPVFDAGWLADGATVVSIGSFAPDRSEAPPELLSRAGAVVVDDVDTAAEHAGPVVRALAAGLLAQHDLVSLGEVVAGRKPGRTDASEIVFYNSVGIGVQDAAAAAAVLDAARGQDIGLTVDL